jgi:DNA-binding GntR family transcriptional regulator
MASELWAAAGAEIPNRPMTARERVESVLRERILRGDWTSGTRLDMDALAAEFGTSRTPVREACIDLAHDELVEITPRVGITVRPLSAETVFDNFEIMRELSAIAAGWAAERITPAELDRIRQLQDEVVAAVRSGRGPGPASWLFHREVNRACKSPRLLKLLGASGRLIPRTLLDFFPEHQASSIDEHDTLVDALAARDRAAAAEVTRQHLDEVAELVRERVIRLMAAKEAKKAKASGQ